MVTRVRRAPSDWDDLLYRRDLWTPIAEGVAGLPHQLCVLVRNGLGVDPLCRHLEHDSRSVGTPTETPGRGPGSISAGFLYSLLGSSIGAAQASSLGSMNPRMERRRWLNVPFLFARDGIGIFLLAAVATVLIYFSVRADSVRFEHDKVPDVDLSWKRQNVLSPVLAILYALVLSLLAFDLIMSLDPHWTSTLFGGYYFVGSFYIALAALTLLSALMRKTSALEPIASSSSLS